MAMSRERRITRLAVLRRRAPLPARRRLLLAVLLLSAAAACSGEVEDGPEGTWADAPGSRVVVLAPAAAELLDRVVGIGEFGPWPAAIERLPAVGGYDSPNVERLLELDCDLLLTARSDAALDAHRRLREVGIRVETLDTSTYEGIFESLIRVGEIFHREPEARGLERRIRAELAAVAERASAAPRRRVLVVVGRDPLYVAGPGSHIDEMIRLVGGTNVADDALSPYQQLSLEVVLERMPEVIVDLSDNRNGTARGRRPGPWEEWEFLPAVHDGRVHWVEPGRLVIPGLRLPEMTLLMGRLIQPEIFGELSPEPAGEPSAPAGGED
jgi:iron complex transport system substrate-binding protein